MKGNPLGTVHLGIFIKGYLSKGNSRDINANIHNIY